MFNVKNVITSALLILSASDLIYSMQKEPVKAAQLQELPTDLKKYIMKMLIDTTKSKTIDHAIIGIKKSMLVMKNPTMPEQPSLADDPVLNGYIIKALNVHFPDQTVEEIAELLATSGAKAWLATWKANKHKGVALFEAIGQGSLEKAQEALDQGADVDSRESNQGYTPLIEAVRQFNVPLVKLLLDNGALVNAAGSYGNLTALMEAVRLNPKNGEDKLAVVKMLLDHNANPNLTAYSQTALRWALDTISATPEDKSLKNSILELLLVHGADINKPDLNGVTPLSAAAGDDDLESVKFLLAHKASTKPTQKNVKSALDRAVLKGARPKIIELLTAASENGQ